MLEIGQISFIHFKHHPCLTSGLGKAEEGRREKQKHGWLLIISYAHFAFLNSQMSKARQVLTSKLPYNPFQRPDATIASLNSHFAESAS